MNDTTPDTMPDTMDCATAHDVVPVAEAAVALGVTDDAIRARLRRGTLAGEKRGNTWVVDREALIATLQHDTTRHDVARSQDTTSRDATDPVVRHNATPTVDLSPLAELIERQARELVEAREAAAVWQTRAMHLEHQLQQITATAGEAPGSLESDRGDDEDVEDLVETAAQERGIWARLQRWWRGNMPR